MPRPVPPCTDELGAAQVLHQAILDSTGYAVVSMAPDGVVRTFNRAAEQISGYSAAEVVGKRRFDSLLDGEEILAHAMELSAELPRTIEPGFAVIAELAHSGDSHELEWTLIAKGGERVPVFLSLTVIDAGGGADGYLAVAVDISARKEADFRQQRSDICMRATLENTPNVAVQWYDLSGRLLFWNNASERFYGWSPKEALGRTLDALSHSPEQAAAFLESLATLARDGGYIGPLESTLRRRDGSEIIVVSTLFPIPGDAVAPYFVRMDIDISDRYRAEAEVRKHRNTLKAAMDAMPGIVYLLDSAGRLLSWNHNLENFTGRSAAELEGHNLLEFVHPEDQAMAKRKARWILRSGALSNTELRLVGRQRATAHMLANGARVILDGKACLVGAAVDISARKQMEKELAHSKRKLIERNESLHVLNELSSRLHGNLEVDAIVQSTLDALSGYSRVNIFGIFLYDQSKRHLVLAASRGLDDSLTRSAGVLPTTGSLSGIALAHGSLIVSANIGLDGRLDPRVRNMLLARDITSVVVIPLLHYGKPLGSINLLYSTRADLGEVDLETFNAIGKTVSMALANAHHLDHLQYQAHHDSLTGLPNRLVLHETFEKLSDATLDVPGRSVALLLLDLDRFKEINDTLGHHIGDLLLCGIGRRLADTARPYEVLLCRLGGDEFAVLMTDFDDGHSATRLAQALLAALKKPFVVESLRLEVGGSIGVAFYPQDGSDSHALLRAADVAMYEAKRHGGGVRAYDIRLDRYTPERLALMTEMGGAIRGRQLRLHYQPKLDLRTGALSGFEALVRWQHPRFGLLQPASFIPLIEVSDSIHALTREVLRQALEDQRGWRERGLDYPVAVNISARNLMDRRCYDDIAEMMQRYETRLGTLELEITETALMHDADDAAALLDAIAELGVTIAIDDFGTGHSSLAYLRRLPIHALKIDQVFVRHMATSEHDRIIVRSTIGLAHSLGLQVVAEGVEDAATVSLLRDMDCDAYQGFHLCRPKPFHEIERWLIEMDERPAHRVG